jgi:hypothetical protein
MTAGTLERATWSPAIRLDKFDPSDVERALRQGRIDRRAVEAEFGQPVHGESGLWAPLVKIREAGIEPYETLHDEGNVLCNAGITVLLQRLHGISATAFAAASMRVGVGTGTTAATAADTDFTAANNTTNRWWRLPDSTYPSVSAQTATTVCTFASGDAQFAWQEWGIDQGTVTTTTGSNFGVVPALLNHKVVSLGTKGAAPWALTVTLTIS